MRSYCSIIISETHMTSIRYGAILLFAFELSVTTRRYARKNFPEAQVHTTACPHLTSSNLCNSTMGARDVSAFPSGRAHQNTHKIEGTVISCPHFRCPFFSGVPKDRFDCIYIYIILYIINIILYI